MKCLKPYETYTVSMRKGTLGTDTSRARIF